MGEAHRVNRLPSEWLRTFISIFLGLPFIIYQESSFRSHRGSDGLNNPGEGWLVSGHWGHVRWSGSWSSIPLARGSLWPYFRLLKGFSASSATIPRYKGFNNSKQSQMVIALQVYVCRRMRSVALCKYPTNRCPVSSFTGLLLAHKSTDTSRKLFLNSLRVSVIFFSNQQHWISRAQWFPY